MIDHAARFDAAGLRRIGNHLVDVISPDAADDKLGRQLQRQEQRAHRDRYLSWHYTGDGSVDFCGRLPVTAGEAFIHQIEGYTQQARLRGIDQRLDPEAETPTSAQRHADGLIALVDDVGPASTTASSSAGHHDLVEPNPRARPGSRWEIRLDRHGLPEVLPPDRIDPRRKPRRHTRFADRALRRRR